MSLWGIFIILFLVLCLMASKQVFRYRLNAPLVIGLAWAPALILSTLEIQFISSRYYYLSNLDNSLVYVLVVLSFISIFVGYAIGYRNKPMGMMLFSVDKRLSILNVLFFSLLFAYAYAIFNSNVLLAWVEDLEPQEVSENRINVHMGWVSHLFLGLNFLAAHYLVMFKKSKKKVFLLPLVFLVFTHGMTLQKSPVFGFVLQMLFLYILMPKSSGMVKKLNFKFSRLLLIVALGVFLVGFFLVSNEMRGIGVHHRLTDLHPIVEQFVIYLGATAILNMSASVNELIQMVELSGLLKFQSLSSLTGDRAFFNVTEYLQGINNGTVLMYWWADMGLFGVIYHGIVFGLLVGFVQIHARKSMLMLYFSSLLYQFLAMSIFTEFLYSARTVLTVLVIIVLNFLLRLKIFKNSPFDVSSPFNEK